MIAEHPAIWTGVSAAEYHAETAHVSNSALSVFRTSRPLFHARYILGTIPHPEPTEAMRFGSALHARVLEPDTWQDQVAIAPDVDRRTKVGKAEWQNFIDHFGDKIVIDQEQAEQMERMVAGIHANPFAAKLLESPGRSELSIRWDLEGVACKARLDRLLDAGMILDIKTTADPTPEAFGRSCHQYGYARQAWIYGSAAIHLGLDHTEFLHIACGTEEPYECIVHELCWRSIELGRDQVKQSLADLAECRRTGNWSSPYSNKINSVSLPKWAFA